MDPSSAMDSGFWLEILNGPRIGDVEGNLVLNCAGEVLGRSDGGLVGRSAKAFNSGHQTGSGSDDV